MYKCLRKDNAPWFVTCFPSWGRAHISLEQSSYEIISIELWTIQKISLAGWRLFYIHQQIHVHVIRPHHVMSYCIISCHIMSCIRQVFQFHLVWRACWFLPKEWRGAYYLGQICMNSCAREEGIKKMVEPLLGQRFGNNLGRGGVKDISGISLSYLLTSP